MFCDAGGRRSAGVTPHLALAPEDILAALADPRVPAAASLARVHSTCGLWMYQKLRSIAARGTAAAGAGNGSNSGSARVQGAAGPGWGVPRREAALLAAAEADAATSTYQDHLFRRGPRSGAGAGEDDA